MRKRRSRWPQLAVLLLVAWTITSWPAIVDAAARVVAPAGWGESAAAAPEALRRANRWQSALGLRLAQVISSPEGDRFAETVAVFERSEPVPEDAFASEAAAVEALALVVADVVGTDPPVASELRRTSGGEVVWARWFVDDLGYECVLAPSDDTATIVIAAVLATEIDKHGPTLDAVFEQLEGVSAPMPRFSLLAWRLGSIVVWLALGLGLHAAMLQLADRDKDHGQAGVRASLVNLGLVVIGTAIAAAALREREAALIYSGSSVAGLAVWIGVVGLIVAGVHFLLASRLDRGQVQSAPSSGAFASGIYSSADLRSSTSRSGMRQTPDELEQSSSWSRPYPGASQSQGRIVIDEAERE
ncbi:MAG: hypothetical protein R6X02_33580 [Enhygromyxa sp.]